MKAIRLKTNNLPIRTEVLFSHLRYNGFSISNPDCTKGGYLDIIVRGGWRIAGFDLFINEVEWPVFESNELYQVTDWIEDHGNAEA